MAIADCTAQPVLKQQEAVKTLPGPTEVSLFTTVCYRLRLTAAPLFGRKSRNKAVFTVPSL